MLSCGWPVSESSLLGTSSFYMGKMNSGPLLSHLSNESTVLIGEELQNFERYLLRLIIVLSVSRGQWYHKAPNVHHNIKLACSSHDAESLKVKLHVI